MKFTEKLLKEIGCCEEGIKKFLNTPDIRNIEFPINSFVTDNCELYNDAKSAQLYYSEKFKKRLFTTLKYENGNENLPCLRAK